jgi:hypothetical protein
MVVGGLWAAFGVTVGLPYAAILSLAKVLLIVLGSTVRKNTI